MFWKTAKQKIFCLLKLAVEKQTEVSMKAILLLMFLFFSFQEANALITWSSPPVTISTEGADATSVQLGIDNSGNATAIWLEEGVVKSSFLPSDGSWSEILSLSSGGAASPLLVVDPAGNATAIWNISGSIQTASQPFGGSWGTPTTLVSSGGSAASIVNDTSGNVVAIWAASGAIESSTKLFGGSWQATPDVLASSGGSSPQVAIGSSGEIFAVWHAVNPMTSMDAIYSSSKTLSGSWSTPVAISLDSQNCVYPQIAVDSNGNGLAIWYRYTLNGSQYTNVVVQSSKYSASGTTWSDPVDLSSAGILNPADLNASVIYSSAGNAIAVWTNSADGSSYTISSAFLGVNGSWTNSTDIVTDLYANSFSTGFDPAGYVYLAFTQYDYPSSSLVIKNNVTVLDGLAWNYWTPNGTISNGNQNAFPDVAITNSVPPNAGVAAWNSYNGSNLIIQAVSGVGSALLPPTDLSVVQNETDYGVLQQYANTVSWVASPSPSVRFYAVFRNGIRIRNVGSYMTSIVDPNAAPGGSVTYGVASLDGQTGEISTVATVSYP